MLEREIARREGLVQRALALIEEGDTARKGKDFAAAVVAYREAYEILPATPTNTELRGRALHAFSEVSVVHAESLAMNARYAEANTALDGVLLPGWNPDYQPALKLKQQIQDPEYYNPANTPGHVSNVVEVAKLLRLAQGYYDLGDFDRATETYNRVLVIDRYNKAARRGLEAVEGQVSDYHRSSRSHTRTAALRAVDALWETAVPARLQAGIGPSSHEALGGSPFGAGRTAREKVHTIIVPQFQLLDATLEEAVQFVAMQSKALDTAEPDPAKRGINIVLSGDATLGNRRVSISLSDVPLDYVLDTIAKLANTEVRIDDYIVTIGPADPSALETRPYRVPPGFFTASAASLGGSDAFADGAAPSGPAFTRVSPQDILAQNGVTFPEGASAHFSAVTGMMTVRNTATNHEMIRTIIDTALASAPKQVYLQCRMIEVNQENSEEIGFDWLLGQFNIGGSNKTFASGGTIGNQVGSSDSQAQNFPLVPPYSGAAPVGQYPLTAGNRSGNAAIQPNSIDHLLSSAQRGIDLTQKAPGVFGLAGVYTDPQFQVVMRGINQKKGFDVLSTPAVLTKSGYRARVEVIREFIYPTEFEPPEIPQDFGGGGSSFINLTTGQGFSTGGGTNTFPVTPTTPTTFETKKLGHYFEVEATVGGDNRTIDIDVTPHFSDFEGFVNYGTPIQTYVGTNQPPQILTPNEILQPVFKTNRSDGPIKVTLYSGCTMVIAALNVDETQSVEDKTPILGDIPFLGRLFRTHATRFKQKAVVFSVTATVIDPAGETPPAGIAGQSGQ